MFINKVIVKNYMTYSIYLFFVFIFLFAFKLNIDTLVHHSVDSEKAKVYNEKMDLVLKKVYDVKIKDTSELALFINSLDKNNEILIELSILNKEIRKDFKINVSEYNYFDKLFEKLY